MRTVIAALTILSALQAKTPQQSNNNNTPPPFTRGTPFDSECQPDMRVWGDAEFLYWWSRNAPVPVAIATTGSTSDTHPAALGQPGTKELFGNETIQNNGQAGFRAAVRSWRVDDCNDYAIEGSGFYLPEKTVVPFSEQSADVLGVPFNNVAPTLPGSGTGGWSSTNLGETAVLVGFSPNGYTGTITAKSTSQLWGLELNGLFHFYSCPTSRSRLSGILGAAYTDLSEHLDMRYTTLSSTQGPLAKTVIKDKFWTRNEIYAAQVGVRGELSEGWFFTSFVAKVGLGGALEIARINGSFADVTPNLYTNHGASNTSGIFAQPTNSGKHTQWRFEAVPAFTWRFGANLLRGLRLSVGYDLLFLSNVLRPGNQIDTNINESQVGSSGSGDVATLSGAARPKARMDTTYYWAQGVNCGLEARF